MCAALSISLLGSVSSATGAVEGGGTNNTNNMLTNGPSNSASSANGAGGSQSGAQMAAIAMAAMMAMMCNKPQGNVAPCIMAAMAAMQAASLGDTSNGAYNNAQQYSTNPGAAPTAPGAGAPGSGASVSGIKQTLQKQGAKISDDGKSMTLPDGSTVPLNADSASEASSAEPTSVTSQPWA